MGIIPESTGPSTPQEPAKPLIKQKSSKSPENLIASQRIKKADIQQKPEHQVGKENLTPTRESEKMGAVEKATSQMVERVKKPSSIFGTVRGMLSSKKKTAGEAAATAGPRAEGGITTNEGRAAKRLMEEIGKNTAVEGLFRVEGQKNETTPLIENLLKKPMDAPLGTNVQNMTSALKTLFKDKKNGLIKGEAAKAFAKVNPESEQAIGQLKACIAKMSSEDRALLQGFCHLAKTISDHSNTNKMSLNNIAIATGPSIYHSEATDFATLANETLAGNKTLALLLEKQDEVFSR